jgi:hypothetical protein
MSSITNKFLSEENPQQIQEIIDAENARLDAKEQSYQNMEFGKHRILQLNQNYQERTTFFNRILFSIFITLTFTVLLMYLNKIFPDYGTLITFFLILVISIGIIHSVYLYMIFQGRNPMNFDEIIYGSPNANATPANASQAAAAASANITKKPVIVPNQSSCVGPACCNAEDVVWDAGNNVCISTGIGSGNILFNGGNLIGGIGGIDGNLIGGIDGNLIGGIDGNLIGGNLVGESNYPGMQSTKLSMTTTSLPSVPKLVLGQIFLGPLGRNIIQVEDSKTFIFTILHLKNIIYTSLDGIHFINSLDGKETATVVTSGPQGPMGQQINGQGIMLHRGKNTSYFYSSNHPPLLLKGDIFLSDSQVIIEVLSSNEFVLKTNHTSNIMRTYNSVDGFEFIDIANNNNKAKIVTHGPLSSMGDNILGQGLLLSEDNKNVYFYYSRNNNSNTDFNNVIYETPSATFAPASTIVDNPTIAPTSAPAPAVTDKPTSAPKDKAPEVTKKSTPTSAPKDTSSFPNNDPALVAYLPFDGDTNNKAPSKNTNFTAFTSNMEGNYVFDTNNKKINSKSMYLNGNNSYVRIPFIPSTLIATNGGMTFSVWVNFGTNNSGTNDGSRVFNFSNGKAVDNVLLSFVDNNGGQISCTVFNGDRGTSAQVAGGLKDGNWHHIIWIMTHAYQGQANSKWFIFVDGNYIPTQTNTDGNENFFYPININRTMNSFGAEDWDDSPGQCFRGNMQEFRAYQRILLPKEVLTLYNYKGSKDNFTTLFETEPFVENIRPIYVNQYKVYPTLKTKKPKHGYKPIQEDLPYSEYKTSTDLFPF